MVQPREQFDPRERYPLRGGYASGLLQVGVTALPPGTDLPHGLSVVLRDAQICYRSGAESAQIGVLRHTYRSSVITRAL